MPLMVTRLADGGTRALREIAAPERRRAGDRAHVDDRAALALVDHPLARATREQEVARQVRPQHIVPDLERKHLRPTLHRIAPGVIDQEVDASEARVEPGEHYLDVVDRARVARPGRALRASRWRELPVSANRSPSRFVTTNRARPFPQIQERSPGQYAPPAPVINATRPSSRNRAVIEASCWIIQLGRIYRAPLPE